MSTDAAGVCALVIARLDGVRAGEWPGGAVYTYGAGPGDPRLVPAPTRTTVLTVEGGVGRWFDIAVREVHPVADPASVLFSDADILAALAGRAGLPPPSMW